MQHLWATHSLRHPLMAHDNTLGNEGRLVVSAVPLGPSELEACVLGGVMCDIVGRHLRGTSKRDSEHQ